MMQCLGCGDVFGAIGGLMNHGRYSKTCTPEMRFWGKVKKTDGCWLWQGAVNTTGYGMASWAGKKNIVAHRLAYELVRGPVPAGLLALHKCDTPSCVNPEHLFFGTDADNTADKVAKDRHARGERNRHAKLTDAEVIAIRASYSGEWGGITKIAKQRGLTESTVRAIVRGETWKHIK